MALTKETVLDLVQITELGAVEVRRAIYILEDGVRISGPTYHRVAYTPGADVSAEAGRVKTVAAAVWTPEVIAAHQARLRDSEKRVS